MNMSTAVQFARQAIVVDPDFWIGHLQLAQALVELGENELALSELNVAGRLSAGNSKVMSLRGYLFARVRRTDEALEVLNTLEAISRERYVPPMPWLLCMLDWGSRNWLWTGLIVLMNRGTSISRFFQWIPSGMRFEATLASSGCYGAATSTVPLPQSAMS